MREAAENVRQMWETADWQLSVFHTDADADADEYAHYHLMGNIAENYRTPITNQI